MTEIRMRKDPLGADVNSTSIPRRVNVISLKRCGNNADSTSVWPVGRDERGVPCPDILIEQLKNTVFFSFYGAHLTSIKYDQHYH